MPLSRSRGRPYGSSRQPQFVAGRLSWTQLVQTFAALAQFDQADHNEKREQRTRPKVLGALAVGIDDTTGEKTVLSERRREHWPEPALRTPTYNHARLLETDAIRARAGGAINRHMKKIGEFLRPRRVI